MLKNNLQIINGTEVWSYTTKVGIIHKHHIEELGYWSATTRRHINYVGKYYNKEVKYYEN
jgi:hypothetical protein